MNKWFELWKDEILAGYEESSSYSDFEDFYRNWYENYTDYCNESDEEKIEYSDFKNMLNDICKAELV